MTEESFVLEDLAQLSIAPEDIDYVLMTHLHFDHVLGLTGVSEEGVFIPSFPMRKSGLPKRNGRK